MLPKLEEWNAVFLSHGNGDGRLTAELFVPRFFRANTSAPMGARALALYLKDAPAEEASSRSPPTRPGAARATRRSKSRSRRSARIWSTRSSRRSRTRTIRPTSPRSCSRAPTAATSRCRATRRAPSTRRPQQYGLRAAGAVLHRDRGAGRHQGARQGRPRPDRLLALPGHLRHPGEQGLPGGVPQGEYTNELPGLDRRRDVPGADDPVRRDREGQVRPSR